MNDVAFVLLQGYNANNLETNGVHAVPTRKFVLVAATHPLVTGTSTLHSHPLETPSSPCARDSLACTGCYPTAN